MKLTFRLVFFVLDCWLTERQGEGNQGQHKLRFYFESRQVCTFDFAQKPFGLAKGTGTKVMSSF